jgi:hypothetical protein
MKKDGTSSEKLLEHALNTAGTPLKMKGDEGRCWEVKGDEGR